MDARLLLVNRGILLTKKYLNLNRISNTKFNLGCPKAFSKSQLYKVFNIYKRNRQIKI